jgi:hypothetical protein
MHYAFLGCGVAACTQAFACRVHVTVSLVGWFSASRYPELPGQLLLDSASYAVESSEQGAGVVAALAQTPQPASHVAGEGDALQTAASRPSGQHAAPGTLINFNTVEAFKCALPCTTAFAFLGMPCLAPVAALGMRSAMSAMARRKSRRSGHSLP